MGNPPMKDQLARENNASSTSPGIASSIARRIRLMFGHFWKAFAVLALAGGLWVLHDTLARRGHDVADDPFQSPQPQASRDDDGATRRTPQQFRLMRELIDKQSQPATIIFKNQAQSAVGYLASVDDQWVVLRSFYKEEAKEQTILIPWENILYVRLNTKVAPAEQEPIASRDSRIRSIDRVRR